VSRRSVLAGIAIGGAVWTVAAVLLAPQLSEPIGRAAPGLGRTTVALPWLLAFAVTWVFTSSRFCARYVGETGPEPLALIRILTCGVLLMMTLSEDLGRTAVLPREMVRPYGALKLFYLVPGFGALVQDATALRVFQGLTAMLLLCGALGLFTRAAIPAAAFCWLVFGGVIRQYAFYFHTGIVPLYVLAVLAFAPSGDAWSFDARRQAARGDVRLRPAAVYGWARYACWVAIAMPYLRNGGPLWWTATNMRSMLYTCTLQPLNFDWQVSLLLHPAPDALFAAMGLMVLITELTFAAVLISRRARLVCPAVMMLSQIGIIFLQNILFIDLLILFAFYADPIAHAVQSWRGRQPLGIAAVAGRASAPQPAVAVAALVSALAACWIWSIERYPLTAMQMFSALDRSGVVEYYKVLAHYGSGSIAHVSLTDVLGSEADFRYRYRLREAFDPRTVHVAARYLAVSGAELNRHQAAENRATRLEVQRWQWSFRAEPSSSTFGRVVDRFTVALP
jgi:hypothetical protein